MPTSKTAKRSAAKASAEAQKAKKKADRISKHAPVASRKKKPR